MKRLSWKYVAGLIDGEGCMDFQRHDMYAIPRLRVTLTTPGFEVIELLHNNFGGHIDDRPGNPEKGWSPSKTWGLCGKSCRGILQNIVRHLIIKKNQAEFLMFCIDNLLGKHLSDEVREIMYQELKLRKKDPHRLSVPALLQAEMR